MLSSTYLKRKRSVIILLSILLALSMVLAGCSGQSAASGDKKEPITEQKRVIEHAMGKTEVPAEPKRVVVLTNEGTEAVLSMGIKPIGAVKSWTGDPWYEHITKQMEGTQNVGTESQVNLEAIAALKPDLILGNKMRHEKIYQQLSAIAPTVFSDTLRGEWQINFEIYAKALNKEAEGKKVLEDFDKRIEELKQKAGDKLSTKVSIARFMAGKTRIYQKDSFAGVILSKIGFARTASQDKDTFAEEITKERIPDIDGDILFYFTYETGNGDATKTEQDWLNDPLFKNLSVVKNNKAFKVSDTIWNTAGGVIAANLFLDDLHKYFVETK